MDIREILSAWKNVASSTEEIETIAQERQEVCDQCPFKQKQLGISVCSLCFCPLVAKTRSPNNSCPKEKWTR